MYCICIMLCEYLDLILLKYYSASNVVFILEGTDLFITVFKYLKMFTWFLNLKALMWNSSRKRTSFRKARNPVSKGAVKF